MNFPNIYNNDKTSILNFLTDCINVIDKKLPKVNTIHILGPPGSGKSYFIDCLIHYFFNFSQIGNFNKYTSFPLHDCVNRRI